MKRKMVEGQEKPIIALDFATPAEAKQFLGRFADEKLYVKVGMELFYQSGPEIAQWIKGQGHQLFLDLKLHDIPNTVQRAMCGLASLGVDMVNVHAAGGLRMMQAAKKGLLEGTPATQTVPTLIAVTQLTSTTEEEMQSQQLIPVSLQESVLHYASLTEAAGLDGVVCSAWEAKAIKERTSPDFLCVTPGIRPYGSGHGDQKRVATPGDAHGMGSSFIVVGRPITQAANPLAAYQKIKQEWNGGHI